MPAVRLDPEAYRKQTAETRQALNAMPGECGLASSIAFRGLAALLLFALAAESVHATLPDQAIDKRADERSDAPSRSSTCEP